MEILRFDNQLEVPISALQERAIKEAYLTLYAFAGARKEDHFIFTSSGAEAINHVIFAAYLDITRKTGKNHFLCGVLDEAPTVMSMSRLQELGCIFQMVPSNQKCQITLKEIAEMITPRTALLSLSCANGLTGVIQPLDGIVDLCRERGILFHMDASHVLSKGDFSFSNCGADFLTFNPPLRGKGGLFIRQEIEISPLILGGKEQGQMRAGTFDIEALIELAQWAKQERANNNHYCIEIARLRSLFEERICRSNSKVKVLFRDQERVPHITSFLFPGITSDALFYVLCHEGINSTCGGNHLQHFFHILKACGIEEPDCHTGLSFAFSSSTTEQEIEQGAKIIGKTATFLQKYSEHLMTECFFSTDQL